MEDDFDNTELDTTLDWLESGEDITFGDFAGDLDIDTDDWNFDFSSDDVDFGTAADWTPIEEPDRSFLDVAGDTVKKGIVFVSGAQKILTDSWNGLMGSLTGNNNAEIAAQRMQETYRANLIREFADTTDVARQGQIVKDYETSKTLENSEKWDMGDYAKLAELGLMGIAAYFAYEADSAAEDEANLSPEEKGQRDAAEKTAYLRAMDEYYDEDDAGGGGGGGGAVSAPITGYQAGQIHGSVV